MHDGVNEVMLVDGVDERLPNTMFHAAFLAMLMPTMPQLKFAQMELFIILPNRVIVVLE